MTIQLTRVLHRILGDEGGDDLVNWMGMVDANRSEIRDAMQSWTAGSDVRLAAIDARIVELAAEMKQQFAEHRAEMKQQFAEHRELLVSSVAALERRLDLRITNLYKWMFVFWCGGTLAVLLAVLLK